MKRLLISFIAVMLAATLFAQEKPPHGGREGMENIPGDGTMSGTVKDPLLNSPVQYANIVLFRMKDTSMVTGTIADENGNFSLNNLPYGRYIVEVNFIGYEKKIIPGVMINPKNKDVSLGELELKQSVAHIQEVEILADRKYIEYKIDKKVVNVSQDIVSSGGNAVDVLENTPSVETDIDGNVSLRGSGNFRVLIDGKPTILEGSEALQQIPASTIEQIEIITNPSAKYDPEGVAGIINVVLKKQKEKGFSGIVNLNTGTGPNYGGDILLNYRTGKVNYFIGGSYRMDMRRGTGRTERITYMDTLTHYLINDGDHSRGHNGYSAKAGVEYNITDNDFISVSGEAGRRGFKRLSDAYYHQYAYYQDTAPFIYDLYYYRKSVMDAGHFSYTGNLFYRHDFRQKGHLVSVTAQYSLDDESNTDNLDEYITGSDRAILCENPSRQQSLEDGMGKDILLKADYEKPLGENGKVEAGYQSRINYGAEDFTLENRDPDSYVWVEDTSQYNSIEFKRNIHAVYGTFANQWKGFEFLLGLRFEYTDRIITQNRTGESYPIYRFDYFPTLHISRAITKTQQIQASYSRRINRPREWYLDPFPNYSDPLNIRMGNPGLEPEYIDSYELSYQKRFNKSFVALETYHRRTNNLINRVQTLRDDNVMIYTFDNIDHDYATGVELSGNADIFKWWQINASFDYFIYHIDGELYESEINQSVNSWGTRLNSTFKLKWGTRIQFMASYEAPSITAQGKRESFLMTNAAIRQDFLKRQLSLTFRVRDIFRTMGFNITSEGEGFHTYMERKPVSPTFSLGITYRINNYKQRQRERERDEMEYGGDDDM
ncbi:MAG: TonB-dependent receptor [Bacteroidetes bacterium]|nr:TonB-dependent receptor [Bacteroidota bacterium]